MMRLDLFGAPTLVADGSAHALRSSGATSSSRSSR
jgi:hypothetical protein